jgi:hypothetical protein
MGTLIIFWRAGGIEALGAFGVFFPIVFFL